MGFSAKVAYSGFGGNQSLRLAKRDYVEIPLEKRGNAYFAEVTLDGKSGLFLLDTGASASLLSLDKKSKYEVEETKKKAVFIRFGGQYLSKSLTRLISRGIKIGDE